MRRAGPTELQVAQRAMADLLADARASLTEPAYLVLVDFMATVVAAEAARCSSWRLDHPDDVDHEVMS